LTHITWRDEAVDDLGDAELIVRLGSDAQLDQTIKSALGHFLDYGPVLSALGRPGAGALVLSVFRLGAGATPQSLAEGTGYQVFRRATMARIRSVPLELWPTDVWMDGVRHRWSHLHFDLVVTDSQAILPDAYRVLTRRSAVGFASSCIHRFRGPWQCSMNLNDWHRSPDPGER